ncbi:NAD(+) diphosphatase [Melittangium boletus]|uniref:NAD-capped RNA hydrolase NudC n=1 Tax=Melittangium boletus DSM 14713 TaxID=1294270 RepID=A0A250IH78_9BACT|nr:NAD(+) diphosphatase [Melittangium boletus]ATB30517.1 NADH pyrophosphatase [Melittangium boletus DSM 14713]
MSTPRFIPGFDAPERPRDPALLFAVRGFDLLVTEGEGAALIPTASRLPALAEHAHFLGTLDEQDCYVTALPKDTPPPTGMRFMPARDLYPVVDEVLFGLGGRAIAIAEWDLQHRFCGRCGQPTAITPGERARRCTACRTPFYPRISPAVIVLITRGDSMLLARNARFPGAFFSTLAGFVDVGESLEQTVMREVKEEVGVDIQNLRYFGSQPWPYGRSLMVGFTAEYAGGDIHVDGQEIAEAAWFTVDQLPRIPPPLSIARRLIDAFLSQVKARTPPG